MPLADMSAMVAGGIGDRWRELRLKPSSWQAASASTRPAANAKRFTMGNPAFLIDPVGSGRSPQPV